MIFNLHTVAEIEEFTAYKDKLLAEYQTQFDAIPLSASGRQQWAADFLILKTGYDVAKSLAQPTLAAGHLAAKLPGVTTAIIGNLGTEAAWQDITHSLQPNAPAETPGDATDLYRRLVAMGAKIDESKFPQPIAPDIDLEVFKKADAAGKFIEKKAEETKDTVTSPWFIAAVAGVAAVAGAAYLGWRPFAPKSPGHYPTLTPDEQEKLNQNNRNR